MEILGLALAVLVGITLGLIGSGGSILTVPILVYIIGIEPLTATTYSLFVVGMSALVGGMNYAREKQVDFKTVLLFGIPSIISVFVTRTVLLPHIPHSLLQVGSFEITKPIALMLLFAIVMIFASIAMIRPTKNCEPKINELAFSYNYPVILSESILLGIITGLVGAGGGFLIIPALVIFAKMPLRMAIGTSLFIIAANSLLGFGANLNSKITLDWRLLSAFTFLSVVGIFIGMKFSKNIPGQKLKQGFGWFVLVMGIYIILKELFFS